jgi:hypothetical protein
MYLNLPLRHTDQSRYPIFGEMWVEILLKRSSNKIIGYCVCKRNDWYRNKTIPGDTYLLGVCYAAGAPYIAMMEDDALAVTD